jgi:hypothetical protein
MVEAVAFETFLEGDDTMGRENFPGGRETPPSRALPAAHREDASLWSRITDHQGKEPR